MTQGLSLFTYLCMIYAWLWEEQHFCSLACLIWYVCETFFSHDIMSQNKHRGGNQTATGGKSHVRSCCRSYCFTNRLNLLHQKNWYIISHMPKTAAIGFKPRLRVSCFSHLLRANVVFPTIQRSAYLPCRHKWIGHVYQDTFHRLGKDRRRIHWCWSHSEAPWSQWHSRSGTIQAC